jgi:hypothetical protein
MIRVVTNSNGSGDWVVVQSGARDGMEELHSGHSIGPMDLVMILQNLGVHAELVEVDDEQMEEGAF